MKWEVVTRDEYDLLLDAVAGLKANQAIILSSNGSRNLERCRNLLNMRAMRRSLKIATQKLGPDHLRVTAKP